MGLRTSLGASSGLGFLESLSEELSTEVDFSSLLEPTKGFTGVAVCGETGEFPPGGEGARCLGLTEPLGFALRTVLWELPLVDKSQLLLEGGVNSVRDPCPEPPLLEVEGVVKLRFDPCFVTPPDRSVKLLSDFLDSSSSF